MAWDVEYTDEFEAWWLGLAPYRVLYAFDPRRTAILLAGDSKAGDDRFYERMIPAADRLYEEHLQTLSTEGLIDG